MQKYETKLFRKLIDLKLNSYLIYLFLFFLSDFVDVLDCKRGLITGPMEGSDGLSAVVVNDPSVFLMGDLSISDVVGWGEKTFTKVETFGVEVACDEVILGRDLIINLSREK